MRVAMTIWDGRVSPVFDTARELLIARVDGQELLDRQQENLGQQSPGQRVDRIRALNVDTLICGAISRPLEEMLVSAGVRVISQISGQAEVVLGAFLSGQLEGPAFLMPGCQRTWPSSSRPHEKAARNRDVHLNRKPV